MKSAPVIKAFGGHYKLAELLKVQPSTIYRWGYSPERGGSGGYIPTRKIPVIERLAVEQGVELTS